MKAIKKESIDAVIRITKKYVQTGDRDFITAKHSVATDVSIQATGETSGWLAVCDLVSGIVGPCGLCKNATNEEIYSILKILGYTIEDAE